MFEKEAVNLGEQVHTAFSVAIFVAAIDAVILVRVNHQVKLLAIRNHGLDEFHGILVMHIVISAAVAKEVVALNHGRIVDWRIQIVAVVSVSLVPSAN